MVPSEYDLIQKAMHKLTIEHRRKQKDAERDYQSEMQRMRLLLRYAK